MWAGTVSTDQYSTGTGTGYMCSPEVFRANQVFEGKCGQVGEGEEARQGGGKGCRVVLNINVMS